MEHVDRVVSIFRRTSTPPSAACAPRWRRARGVPARGRRRARGRARGGAPARRGRRRTSTEAPRFDGGGPRRGGGAEPPPSRRAFVDKLRARGCVEREIRDMSAPPPRRRPRRWSSAAARRAQAASLRPRWAATRDEIARRRKRESLRRRVRRVRPGRARRRLVGRPVVPARRRRRGRAGATALPSGMVEFSLDGRARPTPTGSPRTPTCRRPGTSANRFRRFGRLRARSWCSRSGLAKKPTRRCGRRSVRGGARRSARAPRDVRASRSPTRASARGSGRPWSPLTSRRLRRDAIGPDAREPTTVLAIGGSDGERPLRSASVLTSRELASWQTLAPMSAPRISAGRGDRREPHVRGGRYDGSSRTWTWSRRSAEAGGRARRLDGGAGALGAVRAGARRSTAGVASCGGGVHQRGWVRARRTARRCRRRTTRPRTAGGASRRSTPRGVTSVCARWPPTARVAAGGYDGNAYLGAGGRAATARTNAWRRLGAAPNAEAS